MTDGHLQPLCTIAVDGSLSSDSFRPGRVSATAELVHKLSHRADRELQAVVRALTMPVAPSVRFSLPLKFEFIGTCMRRPSGVPQIQQTMQFRARGFAWRLIVHRVDVLALAIHHSNRRGVIHCVPAILEWDFFGVDVIGILSG
jgi:hypothetical protein